MARYRKYGKSTKLVYTLFAVVLLEFALLIGVTFYALNRQTEIAPDAPPSAPEDVEDTEPAQNEEPVRQDPPAAPQPEIPVEKEKPAGERSGWDILTEAKLIAHGLGEVDGIAVLNCLEGFQQQYEKGVRAFEVDLRLTADQQVVLRHDWRAGWQVGISEVSIPTLKEFLVRPLLKEYTPLSFKDLLLLMEQHPDICIITDTKFTDAEFVTLQFNAMLRDAEELGLSYLFDRMIIQVYNALMFKVVDNIHHFENYIYTLYSEGFSTTVNDFRTRATFCAENGIRGITMWDTWWRTDFVPIMEEYGIPVFTHTVNDPEAARTLLSSGVSGIYTDSLVPAELEVPEEDIPLEGE